jgi:hypothetical protein
MKTYDLRDDAGRVYAFEVSTLLLGRRRACAIAARIPGVTITRTPRQWVISEPEDFCEFEFEGIVFAISEPFGDNSRYWVGPKLTDVNAPIDVVRSTFASAWGWPP